jgi:hypothetical protein
MDYVVPEYILLANLFIVIVIAILLIIIVFICRAIYKYLLELKEEIEEGGIWETMPENVYNALSNAIANVSNQTKDIEEKEEENVEEEDFEIENNIEKSYNFLVKKLIERFNLSYTITPRELIETLRNHDPSIVDDLIFVTNIYEIYEYGNKDVPENTKRMYFDKIKKILSKI